MHIIIKYSSTNHF